MSSSWLFWNIVFPSNTLQNVNWVLLQPSVHWWLTTCGFGNTSGEKSLTASPPRSNQRLSQDTGLLLHDLPSMYSLWFSRHFFLLISIFVCLFCNLRRHRYLNSFLKENFVSCFESKLKIVPYRVALWVFSL